MIYHFKTQDHPEANGRRPADGEHAWTFKFKLANGAELYVHAGKEAHDTFRGFLLREELDDAADEVAKVIGD